MSRPNQHRGPQPTDTLILRGVLQVETALEALRHSGRNLSLQATLGALLVHGVETAEMMLEAGVDFHLTCFITGEGGSEARRDVMSSLEQVPEDQELHVAASALLSLLHEE